jgi:hypothetical protein
MTPKEVSHIFGVSDGVLGDPRKQANYIKSFRLAEPVEFGGISCLAQVCHLRFTILLVVKCIYPRRLPEKTTEKTTEKTYQIAKAFLA